MICRRNDQAVDVDNGTRGTVRHVDPGRLVLETDAGTVRELPAVYVAEHVEHAYALTGHGMQGGTVEWAAVVAEPRDLTRGWSYTALSRARESTQLHVHGVEDERPEDLAERGPRPAFDRGAALRRVAARMLVRDDEDLAVDQLPVTPGAGRADDPELRSSAGPVQERGAEVPAVARAGRAELRTLARELEQLQAQRASLPVGALERVERIDAELTRVAEQREDLAGRLAGVPAPGRSVLGRVKDEHAGERARLTAAVGAADQQLAALEQQRAGARRELGRGVEEIRDERDGLDRRIGELTRTHARVRDELAAREVAANPAWLRDALGDQPPGRAGRDAWARGAQALARYRVEQDLPDDVADVGPEPDEPDQRRGWRRAGSELQRARRRLGRDRTGERERDLGLERD